MMYTNHELKNIRFYEEDGQYYMALKYRVEDEHRVQELEIPKVRLPFNKNVEPDILYENSLRDHVWDRNERCVMRTGYQNELPCFPGETSETNHVFYTIKTISEKPTKMTVAEIEKKLGYKVEIVAEGNKS